MLSSLIGAEREWRQKSAGLGFSVARLETRRLSSDKSDPPRLVTLTMELTGQPNVKQLTVDLSDLPGVIEVTAADIDSDEA